MSDPRRGGLRSWTWHGSRSWRWWWSSSSSCTTAVNPGFLSIVFAWVIGVYLGPMTGRAIGLKGVIAGFPAELFLTLVGVTALFAQARVNGTLGQVAHLGVRCCRGNVGLMPIMFFGLALSLRRSGRGTSPRPPWSARWPWRSRAGRASRPS